jgi:hypothetical protein
LNNDKLTQYQAVGLETYKEEVKIRTLAVFGNSVGAAVSKISL